MPDKMKVGIIGSSGGSAAQELIIASGSNHEYFIVTDRQCDLETIATRHSLPLKRIETSSNYEFSFKTKEFFELSGGVDLIILYFIRLVDRCLFSTYQPLIYTRLCCQSTRDLILLHELITTEYEKLAPRFIWWIRR